MADLIIQNVLLRDRRVDVAIRGTVFSEIVPAGTLKNSPEVPRWDGTHLLIRPPFYNTHTHHAMTLLRGAGEDLPLMAWLRERIWGREAHLTPEAVEAGTRLAILESLRSGCVAFNDMYFHQPSVLRAAETMGVRARVGLMYMDQVSDHIENGATLERRPDLPPTLNLCLAPHALYTTTEEQLRTVAHLAESLDLPIHTHAAETLTECDIAQQRFHAPSPIAYLERCGLLRQGTILAHCCHVSDEDLDHIAAHGAIVAHCPHSNLKLASGTFPWARAHQHGVTITVGTDGAASNNGLSMIAETKTALLSAKGGAVHPECVTLAEADDAVTRQAAHALGFTNAGEIAVGKDADCILIDLRSPIFAAGNDPDADFIYAGDSACVESVICAGRVLMHQRVIPGEADIIAAAREAAQKLKRAVS